MATHVNKISGVFLWLLIILTASCNQKKLVYFTPTNTSKQSVNFKSANDVLTPQLELRHYDHQIDSPISGNNKIDSNKSVLKKYSFGDEGLKEEQKETPTTDEKYENTQKSSGGKFAVLITGLILFSVGFVWLLIISNRNYGSYDSLLNGCIGFIFSLALTISGAITSIVGLIISVTK